MDGNLKTFGVLYYVLASIITLFSLFPLLYLVFGIAVYAAPEAFEGSKGDMPPAIIPVVFGALGLFGFLVVIGFAILMFLGGRNMSRATNHGMCVVSAAVSCVFMPLGTVLGVLALIELMKPEVRQLFEPRTVSSEPRSGR